MNYTSPVIKKDQPDDSYKFQPLPKLPGKYPYHLSVTEVSPEIDPNKMVFYMVGDTGGFKYPEPRHRLVKQISAQFSPGSFLYHLGDLVYHYGEAAQYADQFFKPFEQFPGPIFAIAGNHDSEVNPDSAKPYESLDAFVSVFCDSAPSKIVFSGESKRNSMIQPNVYWTLETPLATIVGLHTNVSKFGMITAEQENWFKEELLNAPTEKMLIICLHHSPYSADVNHGSSIVMINFLKKLFDITDVKPDIVFSGHVHNYQRFNKEYADGKVIPFVVAGAGGFDELHQIAKLDDDRFESLYSPDVRLENFCDDRHGFLQISIAKEPGILELTGRYYTITNGKSAKLDDVFVVRKIK